VLVGIAPGGLLADWSRRGVWMHCLLAWVPAAGVFRAQPGTRTASLRFVSHADASALTGRQAAPARTRRV
jgi:hypothetical protein